MVTYRRPLLTVHWLMKKYKRQRLMNIRMTKTINRKNRCNTLLKTSRTWDMSLTCRLAIVETKTSSFDNRRIRLSKLLQLESLLCQEVIQTGRILAIRGKWRRMELARQLQAVGIHRSVLAWLDLHALMITGTWQMEAVHQHKQQAQPQRRAPGPKSKR